MLDAKMATMDPWSATLSAILLVIQNGTSSDIIAYKMARGALILNDDS